MISRQKLTQKMTEEEKLIIIVKICSYEKLTKKNIQNNVLDQNSLVVVSYLLMKKAIIQNLDKPRFLFKKIFYNR